MTDSPETPPAAPAIPPEIDAEIGKVASLIATAMRLFGEGRTIDLVALEGRVEALCTQIAMAAPQMAAVDKAVLKERAERIVSRLDQLETEISRHLHGSSGPTQSARAAAKAYGGDNS